MQIIINAGGSGTRLWPLSTKSKPKQFNSIIDNEELLIKTLKRIPFSINHSQLWITTNVTYNTVVKELIKSDFENVNVLLEPSRRDTYAAVLAHSAVVASKTTRNETLIYLSSDHYINPLIDLNNFQHTLDIVDNAIKMNHFPIILPATKPAYPATGYGYIKTKSQKDFTINPVLEFKEKPNLSQAEQFIRSGEYLWNLGYFAFNFETLSELIKELDPQSYIAIENIYKKGFIDESDYNLIPKNSFDFAVLEKTSNLGTIDMNISTWDDIGNYQSVYNYIKNPTQFIEIGGEGNKAKLTTSKPIAFVGVSNLLVVENENGIIIVDPNNLDGIKSVSEMFDKE